MLYALIAIVAILTVAALWSKNFLIGLVTAGGWLFLWQYLAANTNLISASASDPVVTTVLVVCVGMAIAIVLYTIFASRSGSSVDASIKSEGFNLRRFLSNGDIGNIGSTVHHETVEEYEARIHRALHPNGNRRKR